MLHDATCSRSRLQHSKHFVFIAATLEIPSKARRKVFNAVGRYCSTLRRSLVCKSVNGGSVWVARSGLARESAVSMEVFLNMVNPLSTDLELFQRLVQSGDFEQNQAASQPRVGNFPGAHEIAQRALGNAHIPGGLMLAKVTTWNVWGRVHAAPPVVNPSSSGEACNAAAILRIVSGLGSTRQLMAWLIVIGWSLHLWASCCPLIPARARAATRGTFLER